VLAPGDLLLKPAPEEPKPPAPAGAGQPTPLPAPATKAEDEEPRSFLLTLLRALGAIHT
jgi:hypothetical protein